MRRCIVLLLCLILLAGCAQQPPIETAPTEESTVPSTEPAPTEPAGPEPGLYEPDSETERDTQGAIRQYCVENGFFSGLASMGERLLLLSTDGTTTLTLLEGENLTPRQSVDLECVIYLSDASVQVGENGIGYYDDRRGAMVFLDENLQETASFALPEDMEGFPVLSPDWKRVYYCVQSGIRVLDLQTGISRLLKEAAYEYQYVLGLDCDGSILRFCGSGDDGALVTFYLSTQDGETLYSTEKAPNLTTFGDWYFATTWDGSMELYVFGTGDGTEKCLYPVGDEGIAMPLAENICLVQTMEESGCSLDYYDLVSGRRTACVYIPACGSLWNCILDPEHETVYFSDFSSDGVFYSWDLSKSKIRDANNYTDIRYTLDNPDIQGLAECQRWAERLEQTYGVDIRIWEEALQTQPFDYVFTVEYQVPAYRRDLAVLEEALSRFPEGFFQMAAESTSSGELHICLVRLLQGSAELGSLDTAGAIQFWDGNEAYISLTMGAGLEQNFYHEMCHVMDTRVLGNSVLYDDWESLNPDGFNYDYDYITNQDREDYAYLEEENRAFIDMYSMSFPKEDRARILEYAMMPYNEGYFTSEIMQRKLRQIGLAIREAFELEDYPEALPWEQYLQEPLTPDTEA